MIKINLAQEYDEDSPFWWLPDVTVIACVLVVAYFGTNYYLDRIRSEIEVLTQEVESLNVSIRQLGPDLKDYKTVDTRIKDYKNKLQSLQKITVSKILRYRPVILMEHLQTLKPEGVWFNALKIPYGQNTIEIEGDAFDNLLVAEFLSSLLATRTQQADPTDLRTQVYFEETELQQTQVGRGSTPFPDITVAARFAVKVTYQERDATIAAEAEPVPATPVSATESDQPDQRKG